MSEKGLPLYPLLNEINKAAANGLPFLAVAMTVALPDICVSLVSDDGRSNGDRYKAWCKDNLTAGGEAMWLLASDARDGRPAPPTAADAILITKVLARDAEWAASPEGAEWRKRYDVSITKS